MGQAAANPYRVLALIRRRPIVVLTLLCLISWLPGFFTIPPLDRDESRFAQASKQMLETGNWVDIRFGNEPRYKKPVGIYWLQATATEALSPLTGGARNSIWTYRVPSLLGALAAVALTFWCARALLSVEGAFLSALLLGLTLLLSAESKIAKTDAVLLATVLGAQGVLLRAYLARGQESPLPSFRLAMLGWLSFALGIMIKGPVIAGVCAATVIALSLADSQWRWMSRTLGVIAFATAVAAVSGQMFLFAIPVLGLLALLVRFGDWRWLGRLRPLWGMALTLLIAAPWLIAIAFMSHGAFYEQSLGHDFGAKLAHGEESHGMPPGYYLLMTTATLWPVTLFLIPALAGAINNRRQLGARFLLAWAGGWWLIELVPTKLPNYILPAYPALAIIVAAFLTVPPEGGLPRWRRLLPRASSLHFLIGTAVMVAATIVLPRLYGIGTRWDQFAGAGVIAALGLSAAVAAWRGARIPAIILSSACSVITMVTATLMVLPALPQLMVSPREAELVARFRQPGDPPPVLAGYTEPSAKFLIGTDTQLTNGFGAAEIGAQQGGLALIEDGQKPAFLARLAELEADATPLKSLSGFNYSRGRPVHIVLYRVTPPDGISAPPPE
jgi:4-amino-4-deoxy-L-arabinose transferase-like glycosyltransferase